MRDASLQGDANIHLGQTLVADAVFVDSFHHEGTVRYTECKLRLSTTLWSNDQHGTECSEGLGNSIPYQPVPVFFRYRNHIAWHNSIDYISCRFLIVLRRYF